MKRGLSPGRAYLLCAGIGLLLIVATVAIALYKPSEDYLTSIASKHEALLVEIAETALRTGEKPELSPGAKWTLRKYRIDYVWPNESRVVFSYDSSLGPMEGYLYLVYQPDGEYAFPFDAPEWFAVETGDENSLRWEGGYMGRRGWVDVTRLTDCFYLEEAYLPT